MLQGRRDRSRSPLRADNVGRRRDKNHDGKTNPTDINMMNQMMMTNMYSQGNMMMGGMFPNMMMQTPMMPGGILPSTGMDMMPSSTGIDIMQQPPMDISSIGGQSSTGTPIDMNMMGGMMVDPSMIGMYSGMGGGDIPMQEKKEIVLKHCKLSPPEPGTPHPPRRTRPPGCRTIFVGGLPDKTRESVVRDIFENYGRIHTLRLSKKNFCHIRFDRESCVDAAMAISGYRITLTDVKDKDAVEDDTSHSTSGWLHVDYAASRDDQNEYERRQRQVMRAQQQQMQQLTAQEMATRSMSASYRRSPSPVRVQPFSTTAIMQLAEKIKNEEYFANSIPTLLAWLERGECSKKNANQFYSMIQATNSHIRRLFSEKMQAEDELQECKERVKNNIQNVINQLHYDNAVLAGTDGEHLWLPLSVSRDNTHSRCTAFSTTGHLRVMGRCGNIKRSLTTNVEVLGQPVANVQLDVEQVAKVLTAATHQRAWDHFTKPQRKNIETWQKMTQEFNTLKEEFNEKFYSEESDSANVYNNGYNSKALEMGGNTSEEYQHLKRENESLQFQLEAYKNEVDVIKSDAQKEMEKFKAQFIARQALQGAMDKNPPLPKPVVKPPPPPPLPEDIDSKVNIPETVDAGCGEAKLIGVMSAFLQVHPQGASLDYVVSYVRALFPSVTQASVHQVLQKHTDVFERTTSGVGANIEHRWSFVAFTKQESTA